MHTITAPADVLDTEISNPTTIVLCTAYEAKGTIEIHNRYGDHVKLLPSEPLLG